jgi:DNA-directed RNA polymerase subunit RPC12/RpoP
MFKNLLENLGSEAPSIKCKACGGRAQYDFHKGSYQCASCRKQREQRAGYPVVERPALTQRASSGTKGEPLNPRGVEVPLADLQRRHDEASQSEQASQVTLCHCQGCGAQVEVAAGSKLTSCPFCDRKVSLRQAPATTGGLHEPLLVPFAIDSSKAIGMMVKHFSDLSLRPGTVRKMILSGERLRKVYLPFWAFDVEVETRWEASVRKWKEPGMLGKMLGYEGGYEVRRFHGNRLQRRNDWLVCASQGLDAELIEELEPFSIVPGSVEPLTAQLAGTPLERGVLAPEAAWQKAKVDLRRREYRESMAKAQQEGKFGDNDDSSMTGQVTFGEPLGKAVVLPLYILSARTVHGRVQIVVNGETGKVASRIPYSLFKVAPLAAASVAGVGLACVATFGGFAPIVAGAAGLGLYKRKKRREREEATFLSQ